MKTIFYWKLCLCLLVGFHLQAQTFSRVEYFIDTDPGFGNAQALTVPLGTDITINANINPGNIGAGLHRLWVRGRRGTGLDLQNRWTTLASQWFMVYPHSAVTTANTGIVKCEFFWDTDPGMGNGIGVNLSGGNDIQANVNFLAGTLPAGLHYLGTRVQIHQGQWSPTFYNPVLIVSSNTIGNVNELSFIEYFIDNDLGYGNNSQLSIGATSNEDASLAITIPSNLTVGMHTLGVRTVTARGQQSNTLLHTFVVLPIPNPEINVSRIEYFIDTDPGFGLATSMSFMPNPARDVMADLNLNLTGIAVGNHTIYFRMRDSNNRWTTLYSMPISIVILPCPPNLSVTSNSSIIAGVAQASQSLSATNILPVSSSTEYRAGNAVLLNVGFEANGVTSFKVQIGGCY